MDLLTGTVTTAVSAHHIKVLIIWKRDERILSMLSYCGDKSVSMCSWTYDGFKGLNPCLDWESQLHVLLTDMLFF